MLDSYGNTIARTVAAAFGTALFFGAASVSMVRAQAPLPLPSGTPAAIAKSIVIDNREVQETNELQPQATLTRGARTVRLVLPAFLYKGDVIQTKPNTQVTVTVQFLD
ncbi:MAG TPA: hypothetical protein VN696_14840, partial [Pyrinomonadaceae bacterium]|nr:hypothetical protein [Pyrinomonadaceae bacterium]